MPRQNQIFEKLLTNATEINTNDGVLIPRNKLKGADWRLFLLLRALAHAFPDHVHAPASPREARELQCVLSAAQVSPKLRVLLTTCFYSAVPSARARLVHLLLTCRATYTVFILILELSRSIEDPVAHLEKCVPGSGRTSAANHPTIERGLGHALPFGGL